MSRLVLLLLVVLLAACGDNRPVEGPDADLGGPGATDADPGDGDPGDGAADDGASSDDGSVVDAPPGATDAATDGTVALDAPIGVMCGTMTCGTGQECCLTAGGASCVTAGTCVGQPVACDGPEDCTVAGEVCCASLGGVECSAAAQCTAEVCRVDGDCDTGEECCGATVGPRVCRDFCPGPP